MRNLISLTDYDNILSNTANINTTSNTYINNTYITDYATNNNYRYRIYDSITWDYTYNNNPYDSIKLKAIKEKFKNVMNDMILEMIHEMPYGFEPYQYIFDCISISSYIVIDIIHKDESWLSKEEIMRISEECMDVSYDVINCYYDYYEMEVL